MPRDTKYIVEKKEKSQIKSRDLFQDVKILFLSRLYFANFQKFFAQKSENLLEFLFLS
jgi:hypothetical protein